MRECIHPAALGQALSRRIGEPRYKLWFENHTKFNWDGGTLTVAARAALDAEPGADLAALLREALDDEVLLDCTR